MNDHKWFFLQFRNKFPALFLVEPQKYEYAVKHFLMTLHGMARSEALRQKKRKESQALQPLRLSASAAAIAGGAEDSDDSDELDQLVCFIGNSARYLVLTLW